MRDRRAAAAGGGGGPAPPPGAVGIGVLASGEGTNLQALIDTVHGRDGLTIVAVASDRPGARAIDRARAAGIAVGLFPGDDHPDRTARDSSMADWLVAQGVEVVVLAGYMALLTPAFLGRFPDRVVNVHPSLLPAFPGLGAIEQAVAHGVRVIGVTVHLVDDGIDTGPILLQGSVPLDPAVGVAAAHRALQPLEHALLPEAVRLLARGGVRRDPHHPRRLLVDPSG